MSDQRVSSLALRVVFVAAILTCLTVATDANGQQRREHVVKAGETLYRISINYGVSLDELRSLNNISGNLIEVGQVLLIPASDVEASEEEQEPADAVRSAPVVESAVSDSIVVPVRPVDAALRDDKAPTSTPAPAAFVKAGPGQSIYDIAFSQGIGADSLIALNPSLPVFLDTTRVAVPMADVSSVVEHVVRPGDTLFKIAREHGVSVEEIRRRNGLTGDVLHPGQRLVLAESPHAPATREPIMPLIATGHVRPYPSRFEGRLMASGRVYDADRYYASHADLPFGSIVLLSTADQKSKVFAEIVDRLPSTADYLMDVSVAVAVALDVGGKSNPDIEVRVVRFGPDTEAADR